VSKPIEGIDADRVGHAFPVYLIRRDGGAVQETSAESEVTWRRLYLAQSVDVIHPVEIEGGESSEKETTDPGLTASTQPRGQLLAIVAPLDV
jgi:hypothetical protein